MVIASVIISVFAAIVSIIALIPSWLAYNKTKFKVHLTCKEYEDNGVIYCDFTFINFSLEPYSILRLDFILGGLIQIIGMDQLQNILPNTLVPPREAIIFNGVQLAFAEDEILHANNNCEQLKCIKVYTTERYDPYCVHLRSGSDDSMRLLFPRKETEQKE